MCILIDRTNVKYFLIAPKISREHEHKNSILSFKILKFIIFYISFLLPYSCARYASLKLLQYYTLTSKIIISKRK